MTFRDNDYGLREADAKDEETDWLMTDSENQVFMKTQMDRCQVTIQMKTCKLIKEQISRQERMKTCSDKCSEAKSKRNEWKEARDQQEWVEMLYNS